MKIRNILKTIRQELNNFTNDLLSRSLVNLGGREIEILSKIVSKGFCVIPDFYPIVTCNEIRLEIDRLIKKYAPQIYRDKDDSDRRLFGADRISPIIARFYKNEFISRIITAHEKTKNIVGLTLAARMEYKPGNLGSGGGWHRDWAINKQMKAILYLSDVEEENGPFQYIKESHRHWNIIRDSLLNNFEFNQNRFTNEQIEKMIKKKPRKLKIFVAKAGTLILVNTRGIHRGMPIKSGTRYALTNYYWSNMPIPEHVEKLIVK